MTTELDFYRSLNVARTFRVSSSQGITNIVAQLADFIEKKDPMDDLSLRILLPRGGEGSRRSQKWGAYIRSELILALKRKKISPKLREVRYIHDEHNFGWILIEPKLLENLHDN
jgi:hypothetical protein